MRQLIIALGAMAIGFTASAQTNAPAASSPAAATTNAAPVSATESTVATDADNTRYVAHPELLTECSARVAAFNDKPCDIIFIGDSNTANWLGEGGPIWERSYEPRHALNFGVSGDKTQNVLWRLQNMEVQNLKPKVAVVLIGKNNAEANTPHEIADGIKAVMANTQATFPGVKIILVSLLPNTQSVDKLMQVNSLIRGFADGEGVFFLNLVPLMPAITSPSLGGTTDTNWKGIGPDHVHLDATGYQIWSDAMEPVLAKLLAGG